MNDLPLPLDSPSSLGRLLGDLRSLVHHEPVQAMAMAFGTGLLLNLLPKRALAGAVAGIGAVVLPPALIALGLAKMLEICCRGKGGPEAPSILEFTLPEERATAEEATGSRPSQWGGPRDVGHPGRVSPHGGGTSV
jgi:hypothetical protein